MSNTREAVALRVAASELAAGLKAPIIDRRDSLFRRLDRRLQHAAVRYGMTKKRGYSREFTPRTDRRIKREIDRVPPTLDEKVQAKLRRVGISLRALTLQLWKDWAEHDDTPT